MNSIIVHVNVPLQSSQKTPNEYMCNIMPYSDTIYGRRTLLHLQCTKQHHCTNVQELLHYHPPDARFTPPTSLCYSRESTNTHRGSILLQQFGNPSTIVWMNLRKVAYLQKYTVVRFEYTRASPPILKQDLHVYMYTTL